MNPLILLPFSGMQLCPDIEKYSFLESNKDSNNVIIIEQLKKITPEYLTLNNKNIKEDIIKEIELLGINIDVKHNAYFIINKLSDTFFSNFQFENLYKSSYGTLIVDFLEKESIFSIEIGKKSFGYFCEINDKISCLCENIEIEDKYNFSIGNLNKDFIDFYKNIYPNVLYTYNY